MTLRDMTLADKKCRKQGPYIAGHDNDRQNEKKKTKINRIILVIVTIINFIKFSNRH